MVRFRYRRVLFVVALILPSVVIAVLGMMMIAQGNLKQTLQARSRLSISGALWGMLEHIKVGEFAASTRKPWKYSDSAVVLVASVSREAEFDCPWDDDPHAQPQKSDSGNSAGRKLADDLRNKFSTLDLKEDQWIPYEYESPDAADEDLWLSLTPPKGDAGHRLLIAIKRKTIVDLVKWERTNNANEPAGFEIKTMPDDCVDSSSNKSPEDAEQTLAKNCPTPLYKFPKLQIEIYQDLGIQEGLKSFSYVSLGLVLFLSLISGLFLWRDTNRNVRTSEMRSQFVSNVSHELKTPVTNIRMFAETLQLHGSTRPNIQEEYLDTIVHESERLTRLVTNILDISNIESGQKNYHHALAPLDDVVRSAVDSMRFMLSKQDFSLRVDICDGLPPMLIDRDALKQAILNLLANAMKYSGSSRVISLRLLHENEYALIQVQDFGIGIAPKELNRIFEKFYRIATPANRAIPGAGLGLAIIAHIVEAHGGSIYVESTPGSGSTFSIRMPVNRNGNR